MPPFQTSDCCSPRQLYIKVTDLELFCITVVWFADYGPLRTEICSNITKLVFKKHVCAFSWFDVVSLLSLIHGMDSIRLYMSFSVYWRSLKMAVNNNRNIHDRLSAQGQLHFVGNRLNYVYQLHGRLPYEACTELFGRKRNTAVYLGTSVNSQLEQLLFFPLFCFGASVRFRAMASPQYGRRFKTTEF